jgi:hypothetical protein
MDPPGTPIGELIKMSDPHAEIGLFEAERGSSKVSHIIAFMKPGVEISLARNCEVLIQSEEDSSDWEEVD